MQLTIDLPRKIRDTLFPQARFKVLYGGRDGAKSWSIARYLLARGIAKPERILCTREVQKSIADSVHQLLSDQIKDLGLEDFYEVQKTCILGKNGTQIAYHGLNGQTAASLKSYEGTTICWVEEAQTITKRSLQILTPTIRAPNSEIIISFNPMMDTDEVYKRFVLAPSSDAIVTMVNREDNPWPSSVLDHEVETMRVNAPEDYEHIYGGACRPAVEGAIYYQEVSKLRASNRLCNAPYDPMLKVHVICDLGFNDFMSLILVQRMASELRIIRYIEDQFRFIPSYSEELRELKLNYGSIWLPHDGFAKSLNARLGSSEKQFTDLGWTVEAVPNVDVEQGIRKAREVFPRVYIDKTNASDLLNRLGRYRRRVNSEGQASTPVHDDASHGADGFRYFALVAEQLTNDATGNPTDFYSAFR